VKHSRFYPQALWLLVLSLFVQAAFGGVTIEKTGDGFTLFRNGQPYFINGAGGSAYVEALVEAGGNSIRTWSSSRQVLDKAHAAGLTVCMGLRMKPARHGADYGDVEAMAQQRCRILEEVKALKDHPALLLWGIGNEVEHEISREEALPVWDEIERIARAIKAVDPNHPVITVIAGAGPKLRDIRQRCPSLDAVGINSYGTLGRVPAQIERFGWDKPYLITEFGPRGWWEVDRTAWGLPIEDTSTEKAAFYRSAYEAGIGGKPNCLGSYVFLWGNKQEKTHTWFGLFLPDGRPTEIVDTMTYVWTGRWPANRAPRIGPREIYAKDETGKPHIYPPAAEVIFRVEAEDPEGDPLTIEWDLRKDGSDNPATGGDWEPRIPPIPEAVVSAEADTVRIKMPADPGNYRLFVYVSDPSRKTATANLPLRIEPTGR
jgi:hypothetical protein